MPTAVPPGTITCNPATDSLTVDSLTPDTLAHTAIIVSPTEHLHTPEPRTPNSTYTESWLLLALLVLLVTIGFKFRNSTHYLSLLAREITNTRRRNNMFDDTVRETSFLLLLNIAALLSGGLLLYMYQSGGTAISLPGALAGMGIGLAYGLFMWIAYIITGRIFTDTATARIWLRGHNSAQGLLGLLLLPTALAAIADPSLSPQLALAAIILFGTAKLIFICKGARIFLNSLTSVVLFFYYLCSLEMVPLILAYAAARHLCPMAGG